MTVVMVPVFEREELTKKTLESIFKTTRDYILVVIDVGSKGPVLDYLYGEFRKGRIHRLILNKNGSVPQWQKSYAIAQAYSALSIRDDWQYFAWVDNDIELKSRWLSHARQTLCELPNIDVVSCLQDERQELSHKTVDRVSIAGVGIVRIKATANGAVWVMRREFFSKFGLPPVGKGKCNEGVEDWYYSFMLRKLGNRFAVIDRSTHLGYSESMRKRIPYCHENRGDNSVR